MKGPVIIGIVFSVAAGVLAAASGAWAEPFSLIVLPDTQISVQYYPEVFRAQTEWIRANRDTLNIRYVLHVEDIVNHDTPAEWNNALTALSVLDGYVPYALTLGNHDYPQELYANNSLFNSPACFGPGSPYAAQGSLIGHYDGRWEASYHTFEQGGAQWLILAIPWGAPEEVLIAADAVATRHPNHLLLVVTHRYLLQPGDRRTAGGVRCPYRYPTATATSWPGG